jgi:hypothetical protein
LGGWLEPIATATHPKYCDPASPVDLKEINLGRELYNLQAAIDTLFQSFNEAPKSETREPWGGRAKASSANSHDLLVCFPPSTLA